MAENFTTHRNRIDTEDLAASVDTLRPLYHVTLSEHIGTGCHRIAVYAVSSNMAALVRVDEGDPMSDPAPVQPHAHPGRPLGRIWFTPGHGWVAAPRRYDGVTGLTVQEAWRDEVHRSVRCFPTSDTAMAWLDGFDSAVRRVMSPIATVPSLMIRPEYVFTTLANG